MAAGGAGTEHHAICCSVCSSKLAKIQNSAEIHVMWFCLASLWVYWLLPFGTLSLGRCFTKKSTSPNPYVVYEGVKCTTHKQPNWPMGTMCVSVCVPWGPLCVCWVRGGQGFNKGTGLVQGCQSDCLGTCNLMGSRWEPPDWPSSSKPTASWCADYVPLFLEPLSWFTLGFEG